ncbi:tapasin-related protein [Rhinophrynus dorsalis]
MRTLVAAFAQGLEDRIKDEIAARDLPEGLESFIDYTILIDSRIRERSIYKDRRSRSTSESATRANFPTLPPSPPIPPGPAGGSVEPVQVGFTRLFKEERSFHRKQGLLRERIALCHSIAHYDCAIDIVPGAMPLKGRTYPLSCDENQAMEEYIGDALAHDIIRSGVPRAAFSIIQRAVDIVLPCEYVLMEEAGSSLGGLSFSREHVLFLLRNVTVTGEAEELEAITEYAPPQDTEIPTFQATAVSTSPFPFADRLLHADCAGEEVACELSPLYGQWHIAHISLPELSLSILSRSEMPPKEPSLDNRNIYTIDRFVPASSDDSVLISEVVQFTDNIAWRVSRTPSTTKGPISSVNKYFIFRRPLKNIGKKMIVENNLMVSSSPPSLRSPMSEDVILNCEVWGDQDGVKVEWQFQKEGKSQTLFPAEGSRISMEKENMKGNGDVSLTVRGVRIQDEGTYTCTVSSAQHRVQQILQLQIREPPKVTVTLNESPEPTLICRMDRYYPLDVEITWLLSGTPVTHGDPLTSSHRRNSDGTYNLSSHLRSPRPPTGSAPHVYTCSVTHVSVSEPILESGIVPPQVTVAPSSEDFGFIISSLIFISVLGFFIFKKRDRQELTNGTGIRRPRG